MMTDMQAQTIDDSYHQQLQERDDSAIVAQSAARMKAQQAGEAAPQPDAPASPDSTPVGKGAMSQMPPEDAATQAADRNAAQDIAVGVMQAPREIVRGAVKGYNNMGDIADQLNTMLKLPVFQLVDKDGKFSPDILSQAAAQKSGVKNVELPNLDAPKVPTVTGQAIESIAQFMAGFGVMRKALEGVQAASTLGKVGKAAVEMGGGDALAYDEQQQRFSNVIQSVPALQNPVSEYLQAKPEDSFAEGKLKQAVEGIGLGAVSEAVVQGVKVLKTMRASAVDANGTVLVLPADITPPTSAETFSSLGDATRPDLLLTRPKPSARAEAGAGGGLTEKVKAAGEETAGVTPEQVKAAGERPKDPLDEIQINYARINAPEDVKNTMQALANDPRLQEAIQAARRGARSNAETQAAAGGVDGFQLLLDRRDGQAWNAEQTYAARVMYNDVTAQVKAAADRAAGANAGDVDQFAFRKLLATFQMVQKEVLGGRAEAGRALQSWSIPIGGDNTALTKLIEQQVSEAGGAATSQALARKISAYGDALDGAQLDYVLSKGAVARSAGAVEDIWVNGLLTGPKTWMVNGASNLFTMLSSGAERMRMGFIADSGVEPKEAFYLWGGMLESWKEALTNFGRTWRTGETGYGVGKVETGMARSSAIGNTMPGVTPRTIWQGVKGGKPAALGQAAVYPFAKGLDLYGYAVQQLGGRTLAASDEFAKTVLFRGQVKALAARQASGEGLDGAAWWDRMQELTDTPTEAMKQQALDFAKENTFTSDLGDVGKSAMQLRQKLGPYGGRFVVPFMKTPANIFKYAFMRTPLAFASRNVRNELAAGGTRGAAMQSKIELGTMMLALGADLALQGRITGGGPVDRKTRAAVYAEGWRPNAIKIGDTYYANRVEPLATWLQLSADAAEMLSNYATYDAKQSDDMQKILTAMTIAMANQASNKTFLSGATDMFQVLSDPGHYGEKYLQRLASSFVPSLAGTVKRTVDPQMDYITTMGDAFRAKLPGAGSTKKFDEWGRPALYFTPGRSGADGTGQGGLVDLFNPWTATDLQKQPIIKYLAEQGDYITMPEKHQQIHGVDVNLDDFPGAFMRLVQLRGTTALPGVFGGRAMLDYLNALARKQAPGWQGLYDARAQPEQRMNIVNGIVRSYQQKALQLLVKERPELIQPRALPEPVAGPDDNDKPLP